MLNQRSKSLLPRGIPKYIHCYDNGGKTIDRYTVVFTGKYRHMTGGETWYVAMNASPFHPQGFGQHGSSKTSVDTNKWGYAPAVGRSNHLGKRILFKELSDDCRKLVLQDYKDLWNLK